MMLCTSEEASRIGRAMRVLIVEDSYLTAQSLARLLQDLGAEIVGPAPSVSKAMALLDEKGCDAAVLDINLGNETVEPVAHRLQQSGRPFFFVSGYASPKTMLNAPEFLDKRLLAKPIEPAALIQTVAEEFGEV